MTGPFTLVILVTRVAIKGEGERRPKGRRSVRKIWLSVDGSALVAGQKAHEAEKSSWGRGWLVVAVLGVIVAAPLLRPGLPATQVGFLPLAHLLGSATPPTLQPEAGEVLLWALSRPAVALISAANVYKLLLALALAVGTVGMALAGKQAGGRAGALLAVTLYLFLPAVSAALYHDGRPGWAWAWAFWPWALALVALPGRRASRLIALALAGLALFLGGIGAPGSVTPAELLVARWPENASLAAWLSFPVVRQVGQPLLGLGLVAGWLAASRGAPAQRSVFVSLILAGGLFLSGLVPALPALDLRLLGGTLLLVRGAAALPTLEPCFERIPWLAAAVALIALAGYQHLAPPFHDRIPAGGALAFFGPDRLVLWEVSIHGELASGETATVTTLWQVARPLDRDYTAFVHVVQMDSLDPIAQQDALLLADERPSSQWVVGEVVSQQYTISLPPDAPPGPYRIVTGLYDFESGERLPRWPEGDSVEAGS